MGGAKRNPSPIFFGQKFHEIAMLFVSLLIFTFLKAIF
jgi:hypothetical protein